MSMPQPPEEEAARTRQCKQVGGRNCAGTSADMVRATYSLKASHVCSTEAGFLEIVALTHSLYQEEGLETKNGCRKGS